MAKRQNTLNTEQALYRVRFEHDPDEWNGQAARQPDCVYAAALLDRRCPCCNQWRLSASLSNIELANESDEAGILGDSFTDFSKIPGYLQEVANELLSEAQATPLEPHTIPAEPETWFELPLKFLDESDQDTVHMILQRGLQGLTLRLVTKTEEANVKFECADAGHNTAGLDPDYYMTFYRLDADGEPTGELLTVPYTDIVSLGVF